MTYYVRNTVRKSVILEDKLGLEEDGRRIQHVVFGHLSPKLEVSSQN
jgi:hypothetical protein